MSLTNCFSMLTIVTCIVARAEGSPMAMMMKLTIAVPSMKPASHCTMPLLILFLSGSCKCNDV